MSKYLRIEQTSPSTKGVRVDLVAMRADGLPMPRHQHQTMSHIYWLHFSATGDGRFGCDDDDSSVFDTEEEAAQHMLSITASELGL